MPSVLLVEDEADVAALMGDALEEVGLDVTVAHDDRMAYEVLGRGAPSFAAIVIDLNLGPGVTGFDVARRARQLNAHIKVIYVTGDDSQVSRFGVDQSLTVRKPVAPAALATAVADFIR